MLGLRKFPYSEKGTTAYLISNFQPNPQKLPTPLEPLLIGLF